MRLLIFDSLSSLSALKSDDIKDFRVNVSYDLDNVLIFVSGSYNTIVSKRKEVLGARERERESWILGGEVTIGDGWSE